MIAIILLSILFGIDIGAFLVIGLEWQIERKTQAASIKRFRLYEAKEVVGGKQIPTQI